MGTLKAAPRQNVLLLLLSLPLLWCCFFSAVVSAESGGTDTGATTDSHSSSDVHAALREMSVLLGEQKAELRNAKSQIAALMDRVKNSESQLEQMRKDQQEGSVAFSLSLETTGTGHTGPFNTGTTLVFKQVFCNVGNGYNADTGFFTAPVRGLYEFSFVLHSAGGYSSLGTLRRNRQDVVSVYSTQGSHHNNASNGVSLLLEKGDVVDVFMPPNMWAFDNQYHYTTFRGHLLFRVEEESPPSPPMK
ncbi:cerebellin-1-like [Engraulis encrasicolus]|uniref:cerebellin-1-like n=1 Tax=Engraulis encrasicolus TaxID=184585 RepID=UPI002FD790C3